MKIDLARLSMTEVTVGLEALRLAQSVVSPRREQTVWKNTVHWGVYELGGRLYFVELASHAFGRTKRGLHISLHYKLMSTRTPKDVLRKGQEEFVRLEKHAEKIAAEQLDGECRCHVDWEFPPGTYDSVVRLPLMSFMTTALPFDEISGVRFTKTDGGKPVTVVLDLVEKKALETHIDFSMRTAFTTDLASRVTEKAQELLVPFVTWRAGGAA